MTTPTAPRASARLRFRHELLEPRRHDLGLTQAEIGDRCGLTQAAISRLEGGDSPPSFLNGYRVARAYGFTMEELVEES